MLLVADDEPAIRAYMKAVLESEKFEIIEAGDGLDALAVVKKFGSRIDLLITDISMPLMDGITLSRAVTGRFPSISIIVVTGSPEYEWQGSIPPECSVLKKPVDPGTLLRTVRGVLNDRGTSKRMMRDRTA
jgi:CheY-like chemotaxis protein